MSINTINIKDLEERHISIARECHLCGETFEMGMWDYDTICPKCKAIWKEIVESREREVDWAEVFDLLTSAHAGERKDNE